MTDQRASNLSMFRAPNRATLCEGRSQSALFCRESTGPLWRSSVLESLSEKSQQTLAAALLAPSNHVPPLRVRLSHSPDFLLRASSELYLFLSDTILSRCVMKPHRRTPKYSKGQQGPKPFFKTENKRKHAVAHVPSCFCFHSRRLHRWVCLATPFGTRTITSIPLHPFQKTITSQPHTNPVRNVKTTCTTA